MLRLDSLQLSFRTHASLKNTRVCSPHILRHFSGTCRDGEKGKRPQSPDTDLRLCSMEGDEGGGGSTRDGAFCLGAENSLMSSLSRGIRVRRSSEGLDSTGSHFSSTFPMRTDFLGAETASISKTCHGFPYDNISIPNSTTSNLNGPVSCSDFVSSSSNCFALQMASFPLSMANNFYSASALPCNSMAPPTTSQHALLPVSGSSVNFITNEYWDVEGTREHERCIYDMGSKSMQPRDNDTLEMLQISRKLKHQTHMEELDGALKDTDHKLILRKESSNSDVGTVGRIVLPKKEAESNLPPLTEREGILLNMDGLEFPVTWKFKYRFCPNNRSRIYIMEATGNFVKAHGLQAGDYIIIYRSLTSENYVVRGKKGVRSPTPIEALHSYCTNKCCMVTGCSNQLLFDKHEKVDSRQFWLEQGKNSGHTRSSSSSTNEAEIHSSGVKLLNIVQRENMGVHHFSHPEIVSDNVPFGGLMP